MPAMWKYILVLVVRVPIRWYSWSSWKWHAFAGYTLWEDTRTVESFNTDWNNLKHVYCSLYPLLDLLNPPLSSIQCFSMILRGFHFGLPSCWFLWNAMIIRDSRWALTCAQTLTHLFRVVGSSLAQNVGLHHGSSLPVVYWLAGETSLFTWGFPTVRESYTFLLKEFSTTAM